MKPASLLPRISGLALALAVSVAFHLPASARAAAPDAGHAALVAQAPQGVALNSLSEPVFLDVVRRAAAAQPSLAPQIAAAAVRVRMQAPAPVSKDGKQVADGKSTASYKELGDFKGGGTPTAEGLAAIAEAAIEGATPEGLVPDVGLVDAVIEAITAALPPGSPLVPPMTEIILNKYPHLQNPPDLRHVPSYLYTAPPDTRPAPGREEVETARPTPRPRPTPVRPPREEVTPFRPNAR